MRLRLLVLPLLREFQLLQKLLVLLQNLAYFLLQQWKGLNTGLLGLRGLVRQGVDYHLCLAVHISSENQGLQEEGVLDGDHDVLDVFLRVHFVETEQLEVGRAFLPAEHFQREVVFHEGRLDFGERRVCDDVRSGNPDLDYFQRLAELYGLDLHFPYSAVFKVVIHYQQNFLCYLIGGAECCLIPFIEFFN